jgi:glycosyltransferase involved in cell wall biosynthesis
MARGLAARGHHVTLCTTDACDAVSRLPAGVRLQSLSSRPSRRIEREVERRVFPNLSNSLAYNCQLFLPIGLSGYLKRHAGSFDVAHLHACRNLPGVIAARHLTAAGVPYVVSPNGTAPNLEWRYAAKRTFDAIFGNVMSGAARVMAVTRAEQRQLAAAGVPPERISLVANPLAIEEFDTPVSRERFRASCGVDGPLVAYLGKLTPRKRVPLLVRAFASLDLPEATLVVAGNDMGGGHAARNAARDLGVQRRVLFTGLLTGRERLELLAGADVLVYPSEHEIFGLVPLEALLCGTPVIVANDSGCGEVIAFTGGGLVVPGDVEALRSAIAHVLAAPALWRAAASEAAKRIRALYAPEVVCSQLERVYVGLAG